MNVLKPGQSAVPVNLRKRWDAENATESVRLAEARRKAGERIGQIATFIRFLVTQHPELATVMRAFVEKPDDQRAVYEAAERLADDPRLMQIFVTIEQELRDAGANVRPELGVLREMIERYGKAKP